MEFASTICLNAGNLRKATFAALLAITFISGCASLPNEEIDPETPVAEAAEPKIKEPEPPARPFELQTLYSLLVADIAAQIIWSEDQIGKVSGDREPWIVGDKMVDLSAMLEDEVLLALPLVNYHEQGSCTGDTFLSQDGPGSEERDDEVVADNPFNILAQLKK